MSERFCNKATNCIFFIYIWEGWKCLTEGYIPTQYLFVSVNAEVCVCVNHPRYVAECNRELGEERPLLFYLCCQLKPQMMLLFHPDSFLQHKSKQLGKNSQPVLAKETSHQDQVFQCHGHYVRVRMTSIVWNVPKQDHYLYNQTESRHSFPRLVLWVSHPSQSPNYARLSLTELVFLACSWPACLPVNKTQPSPTSMTCIYRNGLTFNITSNLLEHVELFILWWYFFSKY